MLDPMIKMMLDNLAFMPRPDVSTLTADMARESMRAMQIPLPKAEMAQVRDVDIPVEGASIAARLYKPSDNNNLPCLVYFHGGGWVVGDIDMYDALVRAFAKTAGCAVLSVGYRLSPEHKFPIPLNDCYAAVQWARAHAAMLGINATKIAVGGDSAGGNLAASVALKTRDVGGAPLCHQMLIYPVTNSELTSRSYMDLADGYFLTRAMMAWYWDQYCDNAADKINPLACIAKAATLKNLPNACVITAAYDPLRDEGDSYARRLEEAGVQVAHKSVDGMIHGFVSMIGMLPQAQSAVDFACAALVKDF
jgi:acetyl esterase